MVWESINVSTSGKTSVWILVQFDVLRKDCVVGQPYRAHLTLYGQLASVRFFHMCVQGEEIVAEQIAMSTFNLGVVVFDVRLSRSKVLVCMSAYDAYPHTLHPFL